MDTFVGQLSWLATTFAGQLSCVNTWLAIIVVTSISVGALSLTQHQKKYADCVELRSRSEVWTLVGSQLSPFALKVASALTQQNVKFKWSWQEKNLFSQIFLKVRVRLIKLGLTTLHIPQQMSELDEFPLVPFLLGSKGTNAYDSSAILRNLHIDKHLEHESQRFISLLLEEFFDEWGLYLVHHKRWAEASNTTAWANNMSQSPGGYLVTEMTSEIPMVPQILKHAIGSWFCQRQTRRLPYLFSVGKAESAQLQQEETRHILDASFDRILSSLELIFSGKTCRSVVMGSNGLTAAGATRAFRTISTLHTLHMLHTLHTHHALHTLHTLHTTSPLPRFNTFHPFHTIHTIHTLHIPPPMRTTTSTFNHYTI
jgi:hypothetical protein